MKRALFIALCLAAAWGSPALLATDTPQAAPAVSAADRAFIASIAGPVTAPEPVAKRPNIGGVWEKALCTASANCWDGSTVSCQGNNSTTSCSATDSSCPSTRGKVTCDGVTTWCPICPGCDFDCAAERTFCQWDCDPCPFAFTCSPSTCTLLCRCKWSICPI